MASWSLRSDTVTAAYSGDAAGRWRRRKVGDDMCTEKISPVNRFIGLAAAADAEIFGGKRPALLCLLIRAAAWGILICHQGVERHHGNEVICEERSHVNLLMSPWRR